MSYLYNNPRPLMGEISNQAAVVFQAAADKRDITERIQIDKLTGAERAQYAIYGKATLDMSVVRIDRGDLVFQRGTSVAPRGSMINGAPPVSSYLNGTFTRVKNVPDYTGLSEEDKETRKNIYIANKVSESIRFLGVSLGSTVPNPDDPSDQKTQITVRAQGTMAIHHNGIANLQPGDTLLWKVPTDKDVDDAKHNGNFDRFGRNNLKRCLMTVPLRKESDTLDVIMQNKVNDIVNGYGTLPKFSNGAADEFATDFIELLCLMFQLGVKYKSTELPLESDAADDELEETNNNEILKFLKNQPKHILKCTHSFYKIMLDMERRKIGKVLSYAKPGEKVDILLC